ncbi:MFS transporter [Nostocoides sp. HKS02]|uniref:MFS transporter n=1 Tax=Nostocoides sp. HKS02 TaxID=1813880 RepID=UPI0012B4DB72|nr:MFS transporter [Tetrasphaera sp. HKS02]QGN58879.1 MFS transporter [Tetrasphaera sp. HKS02]
MRGQRPTPAAVGFRLRSVAVPAFGPSALFGVSEGAVLPFVPRDAIGLGATVAVATLVVAAIGIGSLAGNIPAAILTSRFGERRAIVGAGSVSAAAMIVGLTASSPWVLGIAMLMVGFANSVFSVARQAYLIEVVPCDLRARALSTSGGSNRIGIFAGPFLSAGAILAIGSDGAYVVGFVAAVMAALIGLCSPDLTPARVQSDAVGLATVARVVSAQRRVFCTVGLTVLLISAVRASRQVVIPLWCLHVGLSSEASSIVYGLAGALDVAIFYPSGKLMDAKGRGWVAVPCMAIMGLSLIALPFTTSFAGVAVVSMLLGLGNGIGSGIVSTLGADFAPIAGRHAFIGVWRLFSDVGAFAGPLALSGIVAALSLSAGVFANGALGVAAAGMLAAWVPRKRQSTAPRGD